MKLFPKMDILAITLLNQAKDWIFTKLADLETEGIILTKNENSLEPFAVLISYERYKSMRAFIEMGHNERQEYYEECLRIENGEAEDYEELPPLNENVC